MQKHEVSLPLLFICLVLIIVFGVLTYLKRDSKQWVMYVVLFGVVEAISIFYLAYL